MRSLVVKRGTNYGSGNKRGCLGVLLVFGSIAAVSYNVWRNEWATNTTAPVVWALLGAALCVWSHAVRSGWGYPIAFKFTEAGFTYHSEARTRQEQESAHIGLEIPWSGVASIRQIENAYETDDQMRQTLSLPRGHVSKRSHLEICGNGSSTSLGFQTLLLPLSELFDTPYRVATAACEFYRKARGIPVPETRVEPCRVCKGREGSRLYRFQEKNREETTYQRDRMLTWGIYQIVEGWVCDVCIDKQFLRRHRRIWLFCLGGFGVGASLMLGYLLQKRLIQVPGPNANYETWIVVGFMSFLLMVLLTVLWLGCPLTRFDCGVMLVKKHRDT